MSGKPSLAAVLLDAAPSLHALAPADVPHWMPIDTDGECDECGDVATWISAGPGFEWACDACRKKAEAK